MCSLKHWFVIFTVLLAVLLMSPGSHANVRATAILFRHGQRTPLKSVPVFNNRLAREIGHGQLTSTGTLQLYKNGALLRGKYQHLFPSDGLFKLSNMQIMSSSTERTIMSLQSFMAGFFPPPPTKDNTLPLNWQPFYNTLDQDGRMIAFNLRACPRYAREYFSLVANPPADIAAWLKEDHEALQQYSELAQTPLTTIMEVGMFADVIKAQISIEPDVPQWAVDAYNSVLKKYIARMFALFHETESLVRIRGGPLITEILNNLEAVTNGSGKPILIYSAHDITVLSLAYVLGVESQIPAQPNYSDTFMVDLLENGEVQVVYMNTEVLDSPTMTVMDLPRCGTSFSLDTLRRTLSDMLVDDWDALCRVPEAPKKSDSVTISSL